MQASQKFNHSIYGIFLLVAILLLNCSPLKKIASKEGRAVWIHSTMFSQDQQQAEAQISELLDKYASIGINNLFCFRAMPDQHKKGWDFLNVLLTRAHQRSIKVHPIFFPGYRIGTLEGEIKEHPEWLIHGRDGEIFPHLNLAHPDAREYVVRHISAALKYDIDGIHLDYIRFPVHQRFSYDAATCQAFKDEYGYSPLEVKNDIGSMIWCEWIKWNARQVTTLVRQIKHVIERSGKDIPLSAAVFPSHEAARIMIGQEWNRWAAMGIIDILCPMLYTNNLQLFRKYVKEAVAIADGNCLVYPGIAAKSSHNTNTPAGVAEQVKIAREQGADGVTFFSGYSLGDEFIEELGREVFRSRGD